MACLTHAVQPGWLVASAAGWTTLCGSLSKPAYVAALLFPQLRFSLSLHDHNSLCGYASVCALMTGATCNSG